MDKSNLLFFVDEKMFDHVHYMNNQNNSNVMQFSGLLVFKWKHTKRLHQLSSTYYISINHGEYILMLDVY